MNKIINKIAFAEYAMANKEEVKKFVKVLADFEAAVKAYNKSQTEANEKWQAKGQKNLVGMMKKYNSIHSKATGHAILNIRIETVEDEERLTDELLAL